MDTQIETYKGHDLVPLKVPGGWQVQIDIGFKSGIHAGPKGAFDEARKWVDVQQRR